MSQNNNADGSVPFPVWELAGLLFVTVVSIVAFITRKESVGLWPLTFIYIAFFWLLVSARTSMAIQYRRDRKRQSRNQEVIHFLQDRGIQSQPKSLWVETYLTEHAEEFSADWAKALFRAWYVAYYQGQGCNEWRQLLYLIPAPLTKSFLEMRYVGNALSAVTGQTRSGFRLAFPGDVINRINDHSTSEERKNWILARLVESPDDWRHTKYASYLFEVELDDKVITAVLKAALQAKTTTSSDILLLMKALEDPSKREEILHFFERR